MFCVFWHDDEGLYDLYAVPYSASYRKLLLLAGLSDETPCRPQLIGTLPTWEITLDAEKSSPVYMCCEIPRSCMQ